MREQRCGVGESGANDGDYNTNAICVRSVRLYVIDAIADNVQGGQRVWHAVYSARASTPARIATRLQAFKRTGTGRQLARLKRAT